LLFNHVPELEFRPGEDEVIELGKALLQVDRELTELRRIVQADDVRTTNGGGFGLRRATDFAGVLGG
jgi:hypothetical protein